MSELPEKNGFFGNKNASKYDYDDAFAFRCKASDKARWKVFAQEAGKTLGQWVICKLNEQEPKS